MSSSAAKQASAVDPDIVELDSFRVRRERLGCYLKSLVKRKQLRDSFVTIRSWSFSGEAIVGIDGGRPVVLVLRPW